MSFDGFVFEVRVNEFAAEVGEGGEAFYEGGIGFAFAFDEVHRTFGDLWNALGEFADCAVPVFLVGLAIFEEETEDVNELCGIGDVGV